MSIESICNIYYFYRDYKSVTTNVAESYMDEKDVVIIWISEEYGLRSLAHQQILNIAVTRAKKSLVICGANLDFYKVIYILLLLPFLSNHFFFFISFFVLFTESTNIQVAT